MRCAYMKLNGLLENEFHGTQRVPALMYKNPLDSLESLDLSKYEVLFTGPQHGISNQIKNTSSANTTSCP